MRRHKLRRPRLLLLLQRTPLRLILRRSQVALVQLRLPELHRPHRRQALRLLLEPLRRAARSPRLTRRRSENGGRFGLNLLEAPISFLHSNH
jgi:hypothetical protein